MPANLHPAAAANPRRLFYWCHTTSRQPFETGIQRVTQRLGRALGDHGFDIVPVGRHEDSGLIEIIGRGSAAFEAVLARSDSRPLLFIPELTADLVARGVDPACMGRAYGLRTLTLVHDLIMSANDPQDSGLVAVRADGRVLCRGTLTPARVLVAVP